MPQSLPGVLAPAPRIPGSRLGKSSAVCTLCLLLDGLLVNPWSPSSEGEEDAAGGAGLSPSESPLPAVPSAAEAFSCHCHV